MDTECTYCRSDVYEHEALFVEGAQNGDRIQTGQFRDYACLSTYIEENGLIEGTCCRIDL